MQAILKSKHEAFCNWLRDIKKRRSVADTILQEHESELLQLYEQYQEKRDDLRRITGAYDAKQKSIRNRIRNYLKENKASPPLAASH